MSIWSRGHLTSGLALFPNNKANTVVVHALVPAKGVESFMLFAIFRICVIDAPIA
jgi:hypothetical protein